MSAQQSDRADARDREVNKPELIRRVAAANPHLALRDAELVVATIFDVIITALMHGDRVELRRFGAFTVRKRDAQRRGLIALLTN